MVAKIETLDGDYLQLHLEPDEPLEVSELTAALNAFARQYQQFASHEEASGAPVGGRLLVASVAPGSIDINFVPDAVAAAAPLLPMVDHAVTLAKFATSLKGLFDAFGGKKKHEAEPTVRDCEDAVNILNPIAQHGGTQTINVYKDAIVVQQIVIPQQDAKAGLEGAIRKRGQLQFPMQGGPRQRVSMIWKRLDRADAKTKGVRSPDLGLIEEIDPKPHAVMFTDDMAYLKREMIGDVENPYLKVYFVDVEISRVADKVTGYRITGYHGRDDFDGEPPEEGRPAA